MKDRTGGRWGAKGGGGGEAAVGGVCYHPPPSTHFNISRERDVEVFITGVKK